jgi:hypothetical protein
MITVAIDTRAFVASLDEIAKSQIPFAVSRSLNELGKLAQLAIRSHTGQIWNVKRQAWVNAAVKITHFATKYEGELFLSMGIHPPGGDERADILTKFEDQTRKTPFHGSHVVVPIGINAGKILREGQRFSDYHFVRKGNRWEGDRNTFIVQISNGRLLVLQRVDHRVRYKRQGKTVNVRPHDAQPLFLLVPSVKITPNLEFEKTVRDIVDKEWERQLSHFLDEAMATAR